MTKKLRHHLNPKVSKLLLWISNNKGFGSYEIIIPVFMLLIIRYNNLKGKNSKE